LSCGIACGRTPLPLCRVRCGRATPPPLRPFHCRVIASGGLFSFQAPSAYPLFWCASRLPFMVLHLPRHHRQTALLATSRRLRLALVAGSLSAATPPVPLSPLALCTTAFAATFIDCPHLPSRIAPLVPLTAPGRAHGYRFLTGIAACGSVGSQEGGWRLYCTPTYAGDRQYGCALLRSCSELAVRGRAILVITSDGILPPCCRWYHHP